MLVFADNVWHIFAGLVLFLIGLSIALTQKRIFEIPQKRAISLYFWHSFFCIFYFWYSLNNTADSTLYYQYSLSYGSGFNFGTIGMYFFVSFLSQNLNLSYGNAFLVFNILGYIGLLAFASALQDVTRNSRVNIQKLSVLFLYFPGFSFWSAAIGKDALTFMAAGIVTWAALDLRRRAPAIVLGALLFLVPRPHMAGIFILSFCLAFLVAYRHGIVKKLALMGVLVPLSIAGVQFGLSYAGLGDVSGLGDINGYFDDRQNKNLGGGSSVDIAAMSIPARMFTYMFRPLFFDANGILGLVVSIENLMILTLFIAAVFRTKRTRINLSRFTAAFYLIFALASWLILANTTANLGIAVRQKIMFMPMLIVLLMSLWAGVSKQATNNRIES